MAKKKKNSPNYVVTLHLKVEPWQSDILKKRMEYPHLPFCTTDAWVDGQYQNRYVCQIRTRKHLN